MTRNSRVTAKDLFLDINGAELEKVDIINSFKIFLGTENPDPTPDWTPRVKTREAEGFGSGFLMVTRQRRKKRVKNFFRKRPSE